MNGEADSLTFVTVGGSGDLARKKIYPALFALYCQGLLPKTFHVFGLARTPFSDEGFRARVAERLTCRYTPGTACAERMREFLARCRYVTGAYGARESFLDLYAAMRAAEGEREANRIFYLAIPPAVFLDVAHAIGGAGLVSCDPRRPWSRVVIEKPFGRDRESSDLLARELAQVFTEEQTYRIDHYLGKEMVQNLLVLRFANLVFEPIWNRNYVRCVQIAWKEDIGVEERGGYFDGTGILRDVVQNHLLQILALTAMESPERYEAGRIRDEKVKVLRAVPPVAADEVVLGQYTAAASGGGERRRGYREEPGVAPDSVTPTFAALALQVRNRRWDGVPFLIRAGKALDGRMTEIRVQFRPVPGDIFRHLGGCPADNELIIRVQPDEAINFRIVSKTPGLGLKLAAGDLDLLYRSAFRQEIPEAYESLLLDVIRGDKTLFIRGDELEAAWDIFTPALHDFDRRRREPQPYPFGSAGPAAATALAERYGVRWAGN